MGSTEEKKETTNLEHTNEGESILNISKSSLEQNIYVCGNYDLNFFEKNIIKDIRCPTNSNVKYYDKMAKHKEITDWHFFFAIQVEKFDLMLENIKQFIEDHDSFIDFDDFNENSKTRLGKTVIMYFVDNNKDNFINYFVNKFNQFKIPLFIIVGNENINNQIKINIDESLKKLEVNRIIDSNIFKFTNFSESNENNLISLYMNLIECSAFYNELGDEYKYPKQFMDDKLFDKVIKEIIQNFSTLNILVCGRPGVGKSTFINGILNKIISRCKKGEECSKRIIRYIHGTSPITFYDTPGISTEKIMDTIIELIEKKNIELGEVQSKIHAVFYLFNGKNTRFFMNYENRMFDLILTKYHIPVYFLATQFQTKEEYDESKDIVIKNYYNVTKNLEQSIDIKYRKENIEKSMFCINLIGKRYSEAGHLFQKMYDDFKQYIRIDKINRDNLNKMTKNSLISELKKPQDIIPHPVKLCQHVKLTYRLIARSIGADKKGSTLLSSSFLRIISNIFGKKELTLEACRIMIKDMNFDLDKENIIMKKNYKSWFHEYRHGYKTPAEEEISYLADKYISQYKKELEQNDENCLVYINTLRESLNKAVNGLKEISKKFSN